MDDNFWLRIQRKIEDDRKIRERIREHQKLRGNGRRLAKGDRRIVISAKLTIEPVVWMMARPNPGGTGNGYNEVTLARVKFLEEKQESEK